MSDARLYRMIRRLRPEELDEALRDRIQKLSLAPGDVLLVKEVETIEALARSGVKLDFHVPVVYCPGGIQKLSRQDLLNVLEQLDHAAATPAVIPTESSVPL
jgi:hypothetical protein